jgi:hypothetical protein
MKKKNKRRFPQLKKEIKDFLLSEEGKICKKDVFKAGMFLAVAGMMIFPAEALAQHTNQFNYSTTGGGHTSHSSHASHASHSSHGSHSSHSSHGHGAW